MRLGDVVRDYTAKIAALEASLEATVGLPNPVDWAEDVSKTLLDPWQQDLMLSDEQHILLNCSRQVGKSQIVSLRNAYRARFLPRVVATIAPTLRQASIIFNRGRSWLEADNAEFDFEKGPEVSIIGGGRFLALPGDRPDLSIRGDTVDDLVVDEASRVKDGLIAAATPSTATRPDATITYLSTPAGKRGAFWKAWSEEDWWAKISIMANQCSRISERFLERERRRLGAILFSQEYECKFIAAPGALFNADDLDAFLLRGSNDYEDLTADIPERAAIW